VAIISTRFDDLGRTCPEKKYRLGIMGGTFDPIHIGHLACAEQVRESFGLDGIIFIPAGMPVYKKKIKVSSAAHRLTMCKMACKTNPYFDASAIEIERAGDTYTVDTLRQLRVHYPKNVELYFITGVDAIFNIISWRESSAIAGLAHLIAAARPGYTVSDNLKIQLEKHSSLSITFTEVTALAISSSDLRTRVASGLSIRYLTMQNVLDYIAENGLYQKT
jgi:nicotinate-nucleotide adenylyltransferase